MKKLVFSALTSSTKTIINKYFPKFYEEKEETRKAEHEHFEKEYLKTLEEEEKMWEKYFHEKIEDQMVDEMIEDDVLDEEEQEEKRNEDRKEE